MKPIALTALWLCLTGAAHAATVYRCGPDGNVFSDLPCMGAQAFEVSDSRSESQRVAGLRVAALERRLGDEMQRERLRLEATAPTRAAGIVAKPAPQPVVVVVKQPRPKKHRAGSALAPERGDFVALAPAKPARR